MTIAVWTIALTITGLLLAVTTFAATVGLLAVFTGARYERCPRCHRYCFTARAVAHPDGCPERRWAHGMHLHQLWAARIPHLRAH